MFDLLQEVYTGSCIGPDCNKPTIPPSVYCGENCIEKHASYSIRKLSERGISFHSNPSEFVKGSGGVSVIEKATGKMLVGIAAPSEKNLVPWLKTHTSYQILLHKKGKGQCTIVKELHYFNSINSLGCNQYQKLSQKSFSIFSSLIFRWKRIQETAQGETRSEERS